MRKDERLSFLRVCCAPSDGTVQRWKKKARAQRHFFPCEVVLKSLNLQGHQPPRLCFQSKGMSFVMTLVSIQFHPLHRHHAPGRILAMISETRFLARSCSSGVIRTLGDPGRTRQCEGMLSWNRRHDVAAARWCQPRRAGRTTAAVLWEHHKPCVCFVKGLCSVCHRLGDVW